MSSDFASSSAAQDSASSEPGNLLNELEQRQDEVLAQLDELDAKLNEVLKGLGATMGEEGEDDVSSGELPMAA